MVDDLGFTLIAAFDETPLDELCQLQASSSILRQVATSVEQDMLVDVQAGADTNIYGHMARVCSIAAQKGLPPLAAALGTWIAARAGRKVKIKVGDVEIEASNAREAEELLDKAWSFRQADEPERVHEP